MVDKDNTLWELLNVSASHHDGRPHKLGIELSPGPVVHLSKVLDVVEDEGLVVVEDLHDPGEDLKGVGAEGDAGVEQAARVLQPLLQRGQFALILVHCLADQ